MAKNEQTIVVKKVVAGGHGHHGGAWKVAYADFVTAMMCFFLVMWLMSADDSTKAEIANYFNNPNSPWKLSRAPNGTPVGGRADGDGDSILKGGEGATPDDLVESPMQPVHDALSEYRDLENNVKSELDAVAYGMDVTMDGMRFSVSEDELFDPQSVDLRPNAGKVLAKIGKVLTKFNGFVNIEAHVDEGSRPPAGLSPYEFTMARAVAVMHYLVQNRYMAEERMSPVGRGPRKPYTSSQTVEGRQRNRRIEFVLSRTQDL